MKSFVLASILEKTDAQYSFRIVLHWHNTLLLLCQEPRSLAVEKPLYMDGNTAIISL